jgi:hypothetical protein
LKVTEKKSDSAIKHALAYLRAKAIAAHRLGDGLLVSHLASTAIQRIRTEASGIADKRLQGEHLLWAFVLGLYWTVDDHFDYLVEQALSSCPKEGLSAANRALVSMLNEIIKRPNTKHDWTKFTFPTPDDWQPSDSGEDTITVQLIGYTFLIELTWYEDPESEMWRKLLEICKTACESKEQVNEFLILEFRLLSQASLFSGQISDAAGVQEQLSEIEVELLHGWEQLFRSDYDALDQILSKVRPKIGIESSLYPNFFSLAHQTRFHVMDAEDQFVSLPRYRYAVSRQPAHVIADKRENAAIEATKELAIANFSINASSTARWTRFRMAMLLQLQALRSWELGDFFRGLKIRGEAQVELAKFSDPSMVLDGYFDLLLSQGTTQLEKSEFHKQQFKLADATTDAQRSNFLTKILKLPKRFWPGVADVIAALSDAIPDSSIPQLVEWSLVAEDSGQIHHFGRHSFLAMWNDIVNFAIDPAGIVRPLAPALIKAARNPILWNDLHDMLCHGINYCTQPDASRVLACLKEGNTRGFYSESRFSIAYNSLELKPDLAPEAIEILQAEMRDDPTPYKWLLLKKFSDKFDFAKPSSTSKKDLRSRILAFLEQRSNPDGPTISMGGSQFAKEMNFYDWRRSDKELTELLCAFVCNEKVFFTDKVDMLMCLGILVEHGPKRQGRFIVECCFKLLSSSIPGRSFGFENQGPMSHLRYNSNIIPTLYRLLIDAIRAGIKENRSVVATGVLDWLPTVGIPERAEFAPRIIRLLLSLTLVHASHDGNLALVLVGHVESVFAAAIIKNPVGSVFTFHDVMFGEGCSTLWKDTKPTDLWRRTLLSQWSNHLKRLSNHIEPDVRRVTAEAIIKWTNAELEFSEELMAVVNRLDQDARSRVRKVARGLKLDSK